MTEPYEPSYLPLQAVRQLMAPLLASENDTARLLALPRSEVKRLAVEGELTLVEINGYRRITVNSILAYVTALGTAQSQNEKGPTVTAAGPDTDAAQAQTDFHSAACQGRRNGEVAQCLISPPPTP